ncbi:MAG TPA: hypothetical protein DCX27_17135, partial [Balneola sp.]|nr:hypothetical protein [Balneola sp.]
FYFENFPVIDYEYTPGLLKKSVDILRRTDITNQLLNTNQYNTFNVVDGETPQSAAIKYYNDVSMYWSFFITNRLINPFYDWPSSYEKLNKRIDSKYAGVSLYVTENSNGLTMDTQSAVSSYSIGDTINITTDSEEVVATLVDYDRTTGHMRLSGAEDLIGETVSGWTITDTVGSKKMYVGRKIDQSRLSLHHFRDIALSSETNSIDMYRSPLTLIGEARYIDVYLTGSSTAITNDGASIITNEKFETEINDRNRSIRVYSPSIIKSIEDKLKQVVNL